MLGEAAVTRPERRFPACDDCGKSANAPMVEETIWSSIATKQTLLCIKCTEQRLNRTLTLADLETCTANDWSVVHIARFAPGIDVTAYPGYFRIKRILE